MILDDVTMPEYERGLARSRTVLIPFGSLEEHGRAPAALHRHAPGRRGLPARRRAHRRAPRPRGRLRRLPQHAQPPGDRRASAPPRCGRSRSTSCATSTATGMRRFVLISGHAGKTHLLTLVDAGEQLLEELPDIARQRRSRSTTRSRRRAEASSRPGRLPRRRDRDLARDLPAPGAGAGHLPGGVAGLPRRAARARQAPALARRRLGRPGAGERGEGSPAHRARGRRVGCSRAGGYAESRREDPTGRRAAFTGGADRAGSLTDQARSPRRRGPRAGSVMAFEFCWEHKRCTRECRVRDLQVLFCWHLAINEGRKRKEECEACSYRRRWVRRRTLDRGLRADARAARRSPARVAARARRRRRAEHPLRPRGDGARPGLRVHRGLRRRGGARHRRGASAGPDHHRRHHAAAQRLRTLRAAQGRRGDARDPGGHGHGARRRRDRQQGASAGADAYLIKPFHLADLQEVIDQLLPPRHALTAAGRGAPPEPSRARLQQRERHPRVGGQVHVRRLRQPLQLGPGVPHQRRVCRREVAEREHRVAHGVRVLAAQEAQQLRDVLAHHLREVLPDAAEGQQDAAARRPRGSSPARAPAAGRSPAAAPASSRRSCRARARPPRAPRPRRRRAARAAAGRRRARQLRVVEADVAERARGVGARLDQLVVEQRAQARHRGRGRLAVREDGRAEGVRGVGAHVRVRVVEQRGDRRQQREAPRPG